MMVMNWMHKFWQLALKFLLMKRNKECPICRALIGCKRLLVKDTITEKLISTIIPNLDDFNKYEELEAKD